MASTSPARIDDDLFASAKLAGSTQSRSAAQQVAHWARIGREIEASASISTRDIAETLAGSRRYDSLGPKEQAIVRAEWAVRAERLRDSMDLAEEFVATGRSWVELDKDGNVVTRNARPVGAVGSKPASTPTRAAGGKGRSTSKRDTRTSATESKAIAKASDADAFIAKTSKPGSAARRKAGGRRATTTPGD